ncbi:MAG: hypothetical protein AAFY29_03135 [Pseudomonadota bacterium]
MPDVRAREWLLKVLGRQSMKQHAIVLLATILSVASAQPKGEVRLPIGDCELVLDEEHATISIDEHSTSVTLGSVDDLRSWSSLLLQPHDPAVFETDNFESVQQVVRMDVTVTRIAVSSMSEPDAGAFVELIHLHDGKWSIGMFGDIAELISWDDFASPDSEILQCPD